MIIARRTANDKVLFYEQTLDFCAVKKLFLKAYRHKKDLAEFLLQGRNFILFCLLCYKAVCLFTREVGNYFSAIAACAAASLAMGTLNGEQET